MRPAELIRSSRPTIQDALGERMEERPEARALGFYGDDGVRWIARRELADAVAGVAGLFRREGLEAGSVCAIVLRSDRPAALAVLAALKRGALPVLVAPPVLQGGKDVERTIRVVVERTGATHVVANAEVERLLGESDLRPRVVTEDRVSEAARSEDPPDDGGWPRPDPDQHAFLQLTSGTTGEPKVCVWSQRAVIASLAGMAEAMDLSAEDVCCNWTPLYHDMGLVNNFLLCLTGGIPLVMMRPTDFVRRPERWLRALCETGSTLTWSPNFGFALAASRVSDESLDGVRLDGVRAFWNAAERIHLETLRGFAERFGGHGVRWEALKTNYGCAENVGGATFSDPDGTAIHETLDPEDLHERRIARKVQEGEGVAIVGVGRPAPGIEVGILSEDDRFLPDGRVGRLALRTPSRMEGYLADREATAEAIRDEWLVTGDLAYTRDGEVFWVGRVQERIVINARKYDPSDFERVLFEIDGLRPGCFVTFGVDDPETGTQRLVERGPRRLAPTASWWRRRRIFMEHGVRPHEVVLVEKGSLPKTSSGKRRHRHFKEKYLANLLGGGQPAGLESNDRRPG